MTSNKHLGEELELLKKMVDGKVEVNPTWLRELFAKSAKSGSLSSLQYLVDLNGTKFYLENEEEEWRFIHYVSQSCSIESTKYLLSLGFDPHKLTKREGDNLFLISINSPNCSIEYLNFLASIGVDIHHKNNYGANGVHYAVGNHSNEKSMEILKYLVSLGVDVHAVTSPAKENIFLIACKRSSFYPYFFGEKIYLYRSIEYLKYLISLNINFHLENELKSNAILEFISKLNNFYSITPEIKSEEILETLKFLVSLGINFHHENNGVNRFFLLSLLLGDLDVIKFAVSIGASTKNMIDPPIYHTISHFKVEIFRYLIENNIGDYYSNENFKLIHKNSILLTLIQQLTLSFIPITNERCDLLIECLEYFLSKGISINSVHENTMKIAIQKLNCSIPFNFLKKLVNYLIEKGSNILHCSKQGSFLHTLLLKSFSDEFIFQPSDLIPITSLAKFILLRSLEIDYSIYSFNTSIHNNNNNDNHIDNINDINYNNKGEEEDGYNDKKYYEEAKEKKEFWLKEFHSLVDKTPPLLKIARSNDIYICLDDPSSFFSVRRTLLAN